MTEVPGGDEGGPGGRGGPGGPGGPGRPGEPPARPAGDDAERAFAAAVARSSRLGRRAFLAGGAAAFAAAGYATGRATGPEAWPGPRTPAPPTPATATDATGWAEVRASFAAPGDTVHLDAFVLGPPPAPVREAVDAHRRALDRDGHAYLEGAEASAEHAVRSAAAAYMGTDAALVALTDSTSMGIGLMYGGLRLRPGDELLTTEHDFYATHEGLRFAALRAGARVRRVALYDDPAAASVDEIVSRLASAVTPATRVVAVTWVHSGTGVKLPVRAIADALGDAQEGRPGGERALLAVDGVHGFGSQREAVAELGCDLFAAGGHKWLHGPRGTGVLWGSDDAWARLVPIVPTFSRPQYGDWMTGRPADLGAHDWGTTMTPGGYHSFEQRWALAQAFGFHLELGRDAVAGRIAALTEQLKTGLAALDGVRVRTPAAPAVSAGIVCFEVGRGEPERTAAALAERGVRVSVAPYATRYLRAGATLLADEAGIDRALAAIGDVARS
jgi:selenocysteine lyase/cysteine desulfurase